MSCYAELPQVFTYKGSASMDVHSGHWVIGYTKLVAKTVVCILSDACNNYGL